MLAAMNAQEQEAPAVSEVPSVSETTEEEKIIKVEIVKDNSCLLYTSPSPRDYAASRMPSSA